MNKVLVTGANGFVGHEVVRQLLALEKQVTGLGRNLPDKKISFIRADLTDTNGLKQALSDTSFDCIMHLASLPGDTGDSQQMVKVNVNGCLNILEYARNSGVDRFVLTSSISAYEWYPATKFSPPDYLPVDENHPCRPKDMYSMTKRVQELLAMTYFHQYNVPTTILRLTAVVGPRGRGGGRGWREFAIGLAEGKKVQIPHFSAEEMCHYVDLRDVARMHIAVVEHQRAIGQIFNCCGPKPTRGFEFKEIVQKLVPGIEVEFGFPWSMAQGGEISFSMSKAKEMIAFEPMYTLADSIKSIKDWIDSGGLEEEKSSDNISYESGIRNSEE